MKLEDTIRNIKQIYKTLFIPMRLSYALEGTLDGDYDFKVAQRGSLEKHLSFVSCAQMSRVDHA